MVTVDEAKYLITGDNKEYLDAVRGATEASEQFNNKVGGALGFLKDNALGVAVGVAGIGFGLQQGISQALGYEEAVAKLAVSLENDKAAAARLGGELRGLAEDLVLAGGAGEAASVALALVAGGAASAENALDMTTIAVQAAKAANEEATATASQLAAAYKVLGLESPEDMRALANEAVRASQVGEGSLGDFLGVVTSLGPSMRALKLDTQDALGPLAGLSNVLGGASAAGSAYEGVLKALLKPNQEMTESLRPLVTALVTSGQLQGDQADAYRQTLEAMQQLEASRATELSDLQQLRVASEQAAAAVDEQKLRIMDLKEALQGASKEAAPALRQELEVQQLALQRLSHTAGTAEAAYKSKKEAVKEALKPLEDMRAHLVRLTESLTPAVVQQHGLSNVLVEVKSAAEEQGLSFNQLFKTMDAYAAAVHLADDDTGALGSAMEQVTASAGTMEAAFATLTDNNAAKLQRLRVQAENALTGVGAAVLDLVEKAGPHLTALHGIIVLVADAFASGFGGEGGMEGIAALVTTALQALVEVLTAAQPALEALAFALGTTLGFLAQHPEVLTLVAGLLAGMAVAQAVVAAKALIVSGALGVQAAATWAALAPLLPIALAVAGIIVLFTHWDKVSQLLGEALGRFAAFLADLGGTLVRVGKMVLDAILWPYITAANLAYGLGRAIVEGLWNGLQAVWGALKGWWDSTVGGLVEAAKGVLGIRSPSRVFEGIGQDVVRGFQAGLDGLQPALEGALDDAGAGLDVGVTAALAGSQGLGGASRVFVVQGDLVVELQFAGTPPGSPEELADAVGDEVGGLLRRVESMEGV